MPEPYEFAFECPTKTSAIDLIEALVTLPNARCIETSIDEGESRTQVARGWSRDLVSQADWQAVLMVDGLRLPTLALPFESCFVYVLFGGSENPTLVEVNITLAPNELLDRVITHSWMYIGELAKRHGATQFCFGMEDSIETPEHCFYHGWERGGMTWDPWD